jgi:hypothetical protein
MFPNFFSFILQLVMVVLYSGAGLINTLINKSPPLHAPGYRYLGPGTPVEQQIADGVEPKNKLDSLAKEHDIFYSNHSSLSDRHRADKILQLEAAKRIRARSASPGERFWAAVTVASMKAKRVIGAGINMRTKRKQNRHQQRRGQHNTPKTGESIQFSNAVKQVSDSIPFSGNNSLETNVKNALVAFRKLKKKKRVKLPARRTIPLPKTGGILPLVPIISGISALGGLAGGVNAIIKAIKDINEARKNVFSKNTTVTTGNGLKIGRGALYLPKRGRGALYLPKRNH